MPSEGQEENKKMSRLYDALPAKRPKVMTADVLAVF